MVSRSKRTKAAFDEQKNVLHARADVGNVICRKAGGQ